MWRENSRSRARSCISSCAARSCRRRSRRCPLRRTATRDERESRMTTRYTKDHEYIRVEGDTGVVGITDYAQSQLGDIVYVELPAVGQSVARGAEGAGVERVKAA